MNSDLQKTIEEKTWGALTASYINPWRGDPVRDKVKMALVLTDRWRMSCKIFHNHLCANDIDQDTLFLLAYWFVCDWEQWLFGLHIDSLLQYKATYSESGFGFDAWCAFRNTGEEVNAD